MISRMQFFLLNIFHIIVDGLFDSIPILLTFMIVGFGGDEKQIGIIVSCGALMGTLGGIGTVYLSNRLGFLRVLAWTAIFYGAGFFANAFAQGIVYTGLFFILAMAGQTLFHNVAFSYLTARTERQRLGRVMSDFTAYGDIGRIPLTALSGYLAAMTLFGAPGWRTVCLVYGLAVLAVGGGLLAITLRGTPDNTEAREKPRLFPSAGILRNRQLALAMVASLLNAFSGDQLFVFLPMLLLAKGIEPKIFGSFALGFTLGCFIGKMACGRFLDRYGNRIIFVVCELLMVAMLAGLVMAEGLVPIMTMALLLGIVSKGTVPVVQTIITEPLRGRGGYEDIFSINSLLRGLVNTASPLLFGFIGARYGMASAYLLMAGGALVAVVPILLMDKRDGAVPDQT